MNLEQTQIPYHDYIELYKRVFVFDGTGPQGTLIPQGPQGPQGTQGPEKSKYFYFDLSKLNIPSIYVKIYDSNGIKANGLNLGGDEYSYVDFKKHRDTGIISFYRRNPRNNRNVLMEYDPTTKKLSANSQIIGAIHPQLQQVLETLQSITI